LQKISRISTSCGHQYNCRRFPGFPRVVDILPKEVSYSTGVKESILSFFLFTYISTLTHTFKDVGHLADMSECGSFTPRMHDVHEMWSERLDVIILNETL